MSTWITQMKTGQEHAVQKLWERYFPQLVEVARNGLRGMTQSDMDEEDVALSAFHTFYCAATAGRIPDLTNREDLWSSLILITTAKIVDRCRYLNAQKRGGASTIVVDTQTVLNEIAGREPDPALAAQMIEECRAMLLRLNNDGLRQIALFKLNGSTNEEIAERLGCSLRTIKRRLALIRRSWETQEGDSDA